MNKTNLWSGYLPGVLVLALCGWLYRHSIVAMMQTWDVSQTYAHGYLVLPIVLFLIWRKRSELAATPVQPHLWATAVLLLFGVGWVIARMLSVQVVEQILFVLMFHAVIVVLYGVRIYKVILFPLCYLFFAVPMGEMFVPKLMHFTADFTVAALKLSGIPVFREGMYFSIPAGDFEVAKACSGIRYLMASFSLGTLFAYLTFRSLKKQLIFGVASLLVPIVANACRAYGIVLIAHWSNMQHAVGVDHLIYGWLFFGFVMFILFYIGGRFRDDLDSADLAETNIIESNRALASSMASRTTALVMVIAALVMPQLLQAATVKSASEPLNPPQLPVAQSEWQGPVATSSTFVPGFTGFQSSVSGLYQREPHRINIWSYRYQPFLQDVEMINATNRLVDQKSVDVIGSRRIEIDNVAGLGSVVELHLRVHRRDFTVWYWYQFDEHSAASELHGKLLEGWSWLTGGFQVDEAIMVLSIEGHGEVPRAQLHNFVSQLYPQLITCVFDAGVDNTCITGGL